MTLFSFRTIEDHTDSLAAYLPGGDLFAARYINNKNLRKYLRALASELQRYYEILQQVADEHDIRKTQELITLWERALGIPGTCFDNKSSLDIRRRNLLIKLTGMHGSTAQDFIDLAAKLGYEIKVEPAKLHGMFPLHFQAHFFNDGKTVTFTLILTLPPDDEPQGFTFAFPFKFIKPDNALLECLFNRIKPAYSQILYRYSDDIFVPVDDGVGNILLENGDFLTLEDGSGYITQEKES